MSRHRMRMRLPRLAEPLVAPVETLETAPEESSSQAGSQSDPAGMLASRASIGVETAGADGKAAIVLSLLGIMFAVLARFGDELSALLRKGVGTGTGTVRIACGALLLGFAGSALCAVVQSFRTIIPRFRRDKPSLAFFAEIASMERDEYFHRVESMSVQDATHQILVYNHTAATICAEKYKQLDRTLRLFEAAAACWLILTVVLVFKSLNG